MSSTSIPKVIPAQLSFLAIYNPSLGRSDETFQNQIVFYYSKAARVRSKYGGRDPSVERELREQENEKLRQVGLSQGMIDFARGFSNGETLNSVETHKSRIVTHELEPSWWILASIDLTQLPAHSTNPGKPHSKDADVSVTSTEYSSREVSPPALLLQQLASAHSIFLLHHAATLQDLFGRLGRVKFCSILDKFWTKFATNWDVLLHGSPAVEIFGGIKLAAGGELGMGVGEEEWGSGEREVLEDYARRTDGLVDITVCRFGEPSSFRHSKEKPSMDADLPPDAEPWLGSGRYAGAVDGMVFSGVGALSRRSLRDLSRWAESIYCYGDYAYGVRDNPTSNRRKRRKRNQEVSEFRATSPEAAKIRKPVNTPLSPHKRTDEVSHPERSVAPGIPPPIVATVESSLNKASSRVDAKKRSEGNNPNSEKTALTDTETWMKYLTLGYGSAWGGKTPPRAGQASQTQDEPSIGNKDVTAETGEASMRYVEPQPHVDIAEERRLTQIRQENSGYFIIGLKGDMEDNEEDDENEEGNWNNRILLRTVYVELANNNSDRSDDSGNRTPSYKDELSEKTIGGRKLTRLQPVIYIHRPFIYTFLFRPHTESLTIASFYRNLHTYFAPLHQPLSNSTSPERVAARIAAASDPYTTISTLAGAGPNTLPIYDLIYDPRTLTVHSSIPNIPEPGTFVAEGLGPLAIDWSRVEALNVHSQIVATVSGTRDNQSEIERTCKTNRGWWVVWMRLPPSQPEGTSVPKESEEEDDDDAGSYHAWELREAFLVRRARDGAKAMSRKLGSSMGAGIGSGMWRLGGPSAEEKRGGGTAGWTPRALTEGVGIDGRRYIEALLSLNR